MKFWEVLKELHDLAGQHEVIAENTQGQVIKDVQILIGEMKQQRRKVRPCQRHHQKPSQLMPMLTDLSSNFLGFITILDIFSTN